MLQEMLECARKRPSSTSFGVSAIKVNCTTVNVNGSRRPEIECMSSQCQDHGARDTRSRKNQFADKFADGVSGVVRE